MSATSAHKQGQKERDTATHNPQPVCCAVLCVKEEMSF
jgi:hypothetical protein